LGTTRCKECDQNTYNPGLGTDCIEIPAGSYGYPIEQNPHTNIKKCPEGTWCAGKDANPVNCSSGKYMDVEGSFESKQCKDCEKGTFHNLVGQTDASDCTKCPRGKFHEDTGKTVVEDCKLCDPGQYQSQTGMSECEACPDSKYQEEKGRAQCVSVPPGYVGAKDANKFSSSDIEDHGNNIIVACETGHYCLGGAGKQIECPLGTSQFLRGQSDCVSCAAHQYQDSKGSTSCKTIEEGFYCTTIEKPKSGLSDAPVCKGISACVKGTMCKGNSHDQPQDCAVGTYQDKPGQHVCISCVAGTYQGDTKSTSCIACGLHKYQNSPMQSSCEDIGIGYYGTGGTNTTRTGKSPCPRGKYCEDSGAFFCEAGKFQDETAKSRCDTIRGGYYGFPINNEEGQTAEKECMVGHFCLGNDSPPQACPVGKKSEGQRSIYV
jgi:hypothetical protein